MTNRWRILATAPASEMDHFSVRALENVDATNGTVIFFMRNTDRLEENEVAQEMAIIENNMECEGIQDFSLEATPLPELRLSAPLRER
jgi:hypothetical protein